MTGVECGNLNSNHQITSVTPYGMEDVNPTPVKHTNETDLRGKREKTKEPKTSKQGRDCQEEVVREKFRKGRGNGEERSGVGAAGEGGTGYLVSRWCTAAWTRYSILLYPLLQS